MKRPAELSGLGLAVKCASTWAKLAGCGVETFAAPPDVAAEEDRVCRPGCGLELEDAAVLPLVMTGWELWVRPAGLEKDEP